MVERVGLLIVGAAGANGQAIDSALRLFSKGQRSADYGASSLPIFSQEKFPNAEDIVLSGWDIRGATSSRLEPGGIAPAIFGKFDTLVGDEGALEYWDNAETILRALIDQIESFRRASVLSQVIVLNLSSPPRRMVAPLAGQSLAQVLATGSDQLPSSVLYALAAVSSGCDYVDFTPSETLEWGVLEDLAHQNRVQLAGRDGATGQTFLKVLVSAALEMRGLHVRNWYSTNILGNRDGAALVIPGVDETKQADKEYGLRQVSSIVFPDHQIDIRYMPELGDTKEAWDSVLINDFMGNDVELKLNWRGLDSPLAAQLALDIVRFVAAGRGQGRTGARADLAMFFKHPIGGAVRSPATLFDRLVDDNRDLLVPGKSRNDLSF